CATKDSRLVTARKMGAFATVATSQADLIDEMKKLHPEGTDLIIEATGIEECISNSFKIAKRGGTVMLAGYGRGKTMNIRIDDIHVKNLKVIGAGNNWNMFKKGMGLMEEGLIDLSCFITHRISLDDYAYGLELARKRPEDFIKAVFINE
ncbi:MAG: zinc-binding dehydrogenase, partial [Bacteroidaceae bacterium]|nr:zinc-binding dehydrogenase [Bacteroidaceae bacterium]